MTRDGRWVRTAGLIARVGVRRAVRRALARPRRTALLVLLFGGTWLNLIVGGRPEPPTDAATLTFARTARGAAAIGWVAATTLAAVGATTSLADVDGRELVVPAAGVRAAFLGTLVADHARRVLVLGVVAVLTLATVVVGRAGPGSLPTGVLAVACVFLTAELVGHVLALGWVGVTDGGVPKSARLIAGGVGLLGAAVAVDRLPTVLAVAARTPLAAYGDLFLLGTPFDADRGRAVAAFVGSVAVAPPAYLLAERLARRVWFRDPPAGGASGGRGTAVIDRLVEPVAARPTRAVARRVWLQTVRRPKTLVFVGIPLLLAATVVIDGDAPTGFPTLLGLYGAWAAGVGTSLNPLSAEGPGLPTLLTAPVDGRGVVRGYALAAWTVAVPVVAGTVGVAGPLAGFDTVATLTGVAAGVGLVVGCVPASVAVGVSVPRVDALRATDGDGPLSPSKFAFAGYSLLVVFLSLPALAGSLLASGAVAAAVGVLGTTLLAAGAGVVGYRYAGRQFDRLTLA